MENTPAPAILVVDDNDDNAEIVRTLLESRGFAVFVARDGDEAMTLFESARPALVLLDVRMPGRSGWEVCRLMRQHPEHGRAVRIVMLTALAAWNDKQSAIQTGADDYITKPIDLAELELRVRRNLALVSPQA
ncbi:MAG TPA: response regulator [Gemmatimonadaceae bacterium]|jgi:DNA-binding response OmpR family regulator